MRRQIDGKTRFLLEDIRDIRRALHVGLASFGEIERLSEEQMALGDSVPTRLRVTHPTGSGSAIELFAHALQLLDLMEPEFG